MNRPAAAASTSIARSVELVSTSLQEDSTLFDVALYPLSDRGPRSAPDVVAFVPRARVAQPVTFMDESACTNETFVIEGSDVPLRQRPPAKTVIG